MIVYRTTVPVGSIPAGTVVSIDPASSGDVSLVKPLAGVFGSGSVWKQDISGAPLHPDSDLLTSTLVTNDITPNYAGVAVFNVDQFNSTTYVVPADQPLVDIGFCDSQNKGYTPSELYSTSSYKAFRAVPMPAGAVPGNGSDGHIAVYQPSTDRLWEFWRYAVNRTDTTHGGVSPAAAAGGTYTYQAGPVDWTGPSATWGGRIDNVSTAKGWFPGNTGTTATGLAMQGGNIGILEAQAGAIDHAIALSIPRPRKYATYSYPAQRSDGGTAYDAAKYIPEGLRLRLDPTRDFTSVNLHPLARMVATAAQKYGFIVVDKSSGVEVECESAASIVADGGVSPWTALLAGTPTYDVMKRFPWDALQALPFDYGKP